jgi:hypothetical protein
MTTLQTIGAIWAFVAACSVLFIRGATSRPSSREERRMQEELEEV